MRGCASRSPSSSLSPSRRSTRRRGSSTARSSSASSGRCLWSPRSPRPSRYRCGRAASRGTTPPEADPLVILSAAKDLFSWALDRGKSFVATLLRMTGESERVLFPFHTEPRQQSGAGLNAVPEVLDAEVLVGGVLVVVMVDDRDPDDRRLELLEEQVHRDASAERRELDDRPSRGSLDRADDRPGNGQVHRGAARRVAAGVPGNLEEPRRLRPRLAVRVLADDRESLPPHVVLEERLDALGSLVGHQAKIDGRRGLRRNRVG